MPAGVWKHDLKDSFNPEILWFYDILVNLDLSFLSFFFNLVLLVCSSHCQLFNGKILFSCILHKATVPDVYPGINSKLQLSSYDDDDDETFKYSIKSRYHFFPTF